MFFPGVSTPESTDKLLLPFASGQLPSQERKTELQQKISRWAKSSTQAVAKVGSYSGATYALLGPVWITYLGGNLYLLLPVGTATVFAVNDIMVTELLKKYPENKLLLFLNKKVVQPGQYVVQYFANIGFTFSILRSLNTAIFQNRLELDFKKVVFPGLFAASAIPAGLISVSQQISKQPSSATAPGYFTVLAQLIGRVSRFAASVGGLGVLELQGLISNNLSLAVITFSAVAGLISSVIEPSYPAASFYMILIMQLVAENASLAVSLFGLINSIVAGIEVERGSSGVPEAIFGANFLFSVVFYSVLLTTTPKKPRDQTELRQQRSSVESSHALMIQEISDDSHDVEEGSHTAGYNSINN